MSADQIDNNKKSHRFQPGRSGNPSGRPRGSSLTDRLKARALKEGKHLVEVLWDAACDGDMRAMAMIWDRVEGKVPDRVEVGDAISRDEFLTGLRSRIGAYESAGPDGDGKGRGPR